MTLTVSKDHSLSCISKWHFTQPSWETFLTAICQTSLCWLAEQKFLDAMCFYINIASHSTSNMNGTQKCTQINIMDVQKIYYSDREIPVNSLGAQPLYIPQLLLLRTKEISEFWHLLLPLSRHDFQTCTLPVRLKRKQRMKFLYCHQAVEKDTHRTLGWPARIWPLVLLPFQITRTTHANRLSLSNWNLFTLNKQSFFGACTSMQFLLTLDWCCKALCSHSNFPPLFFTGYSNSH